MQSQPQKIAVYLMFNSLIYNSIFWQVDIIMTVKTTTTFGSIWAQKHRQNYVRLDTNLRQILTLPLLHSNQTVR